MAQKNLTINSFVGGIATDKRVGIPNSFGFAQNLNIYADASSVTLNPRTVKVSGAVVTDLVLWGIDGSPYDTNRYFYGEEGNLYRETSGGTWSLLRTVAGSNGQGLDVFANYLYYAGDTTLGRYGLLSGTPTFNDNFLADGITNLDQSGSGTGNTYAIPTSISETATNRQTFVPTRDPVASFKVWVVAKGTGDWTITLHDVNNNVLGTSTVANASLTNGALNTFTFATPARISIGNSYHFHVTSTVADGTLRTGTANDLETSTYNELFGILISADFHPIEGILNGIVIGNDNYLAFWDQANYNPNQIQLEDGYQVRALTSVEQYIVAGAWTGESEDSAENAKLYFWDGIAPTFNYSIPVTMGMVNALFSSKNRLIGCYGARGELYLNYQPFQLLRTLPNLLQGEIITIPPGAMGQFNNKTEIGFTYFSASVDIGAQKGVYEWGNKSDEYPEAFNFSYTISTGHTEGDDLYVGMVKGLGQDLYIGWEDDVTFGVDRVSNTNDPFPTGSFTSLIFDNNAPQKPKYADMLIIEFNPLVSGESIIPTYALDNDATNNVFTLGDTVATVGATQAIFPIGKRFNSMAFGFNIATGTTFPVVTAVHLIFDSLDNERSW